MKTPGPARVLSIALALTIPAEPSLAAFPEWISTFSMKIAYHTNIAGTHPDWDQWAGTHLWNMTMIIGLKNPITQSGCPDENGCVQFELEPPLGTFTDATFNLPDEQDFHIVDSSAKENAILDWLTYHYKVIDRYGIGFGERGAAGSTNPGIRSSIVTKTSREDTWVHEFGHMQGMDSSWHRQDGCWDAIMYPSTNPSSPLQDVIDEREREIFIKNPNRQNYRCGAATPAFLRYMVADLESGACRIRFRTDKEFEVEAFKLYRSGGPTDTTLVATLSPQGGDGSVEYVVTDPLGHVGDAYLLMEDRVGPRDDIRVSDCIAVDSIRIVASERQWYNPDSLDAALRAQEDPVIETSDACTDSVPTYALVCPDSFAVYLALYAGIWTARGVPTKVVTFTRADSCFGSIAAYIRFAAAHGLKYALLVGDANDMTLWDNPAAWAYPGWVWPMDICNGNTTHPPADSARNLLPTYYYAHNKIPAYYSMTYWTPYYASDLPYADVDGDGLPDILIGRLPVTSTAQIIAYMTKLASFLNTTGNAIQPSCYQVGVAVDASPGAAGYEAEWYMDAVANAVPTGVSLSRFYSRGGPVVSQIELVKTGALAQFNTHKDAADYAANQGAGVIVFQTTAGDRYQWPCWNIWRGWSVEQLAVPPRPFVSLGLTCGTANFDMTEYENLFCSPERVRPIVERLLFDPQKGAIVHIGTTRGSYQQGAGLFGTELVSQLFQPGMNVGRAFQLTLRRCIARYPNFRDLFQSYILLGDPLVGSTTLFTTDVPAGANSQAPPRLRIVSARPNPFQGQLTATISGGTNRRISIRVFDVAGRLVRDLGEIKGGTTNRIAVVWDGRRNDGRAARSGIYFIVARAGKDASSSRVVLIK